MDTLWPDHLEAVAERLGRADILVADCNIPVTCLDWLCAFAARRHIRLLIEPVSVPKAMKLLQFERAAPVFAVTPNAQQLEALAGGDLAKLHVMGFANIVVHRGSEGALASDGAHVMRVEPATAAEIADVTGAGDAAIAGLVCGLLEGLVLADAARLGQCAAAIKLSSAQSVASGLSRDSLFRLAGITPCGEGAQ
jgi:pseudouridine kinase